MTGASAWSVALVGMEGSVVEVEAAISSGLPRTVLVGSRGPPRGPTDVGPSVDGVVVA